MILQDHGLFSLPLNIRNNNWSERSMVWNYIECAVVDYTATKDPIYSYTVIQLTRVLACSVVLLTSMNFNHYSLHFLMDMNYLFPCSHDSDFCNINKQVSPEYIYLLKIGIKNTINIDTTVTTDNPLDNRYNYYYWVNNLEEITGSENPYDMAACIYWSLYVHVQPLS